MGNHIYSSRLIKSPINHIPIGLPVRRNDGHFLLRIKRAGSQEYEDVPLEFIVETAIKTAVPEESRNSSTNITQN